MGIPPGYYLGLITTHMNNIYIFYIYIYSIYILYILYILYIYIYYIYTHSESACTPKSMIFLNVLTSESDHWSWITQWPFWVELIPSKMLKPGPKMYLNSWKCLESTGFGPSKSALANWPWGILAELLDLCGALQGQQQPWASEAWRQGVTVIQSSKII